MARIRTYKPEYWSDEKLSPLPPVTRLVFLGLISMADDAGRLVDNLRQIDAFIFPATTDTAELAITELSELGRIRRGTTASGQRVIQVVRWSHQLIDRPNFAAALPPIVGDTPELPAQRRHGEAAKSRNRSGNTSRSVSLRPSPKLGGNGPGVIPPLISTSTVIPSYRHTTETPQGFGVVGKISTSPQPAALGEPLTPEQIDQRWAEHGRRAEAEQEAQLERERQVTDG